MPRRGFCFVGCSNELLYDTHSKKFDVCNFFTAIFLFKDPNYYGDFDDFFCKKFREKLKRFCKLQEILRLGSKRFFFGKSPEKTGAEGEGNGSTSKFCESSTPSSRLIQEVSKLSGSFARARVSSSLSNFLINVTRSGHAGRGVMPRLSRPGPARAIGSGYRRFGTQSLRADVPRGTEKKVPGKGGWKLY